jgi:hypothetical protein
MATMVEGDSIRGGALGPEGEESLDLLVEWKVYKGVNAEETTSDPVAGRRSRCRRPTVPLGTMLEPIEL